MFYLYFSIFLCKAMNYVYVIGIDIKPNCIVKMKEHIC